MERSPIRSGAPVLLAAALVLAACADDDADADAGGVASATETRADDDGGGAAVEVTAVDYAFEGLPEDLDAGTTLALRNGSDVELHELVAMRMPDEEPRALDELLALPESELGAVFAGPPALVLVAPPGEEGFAALGDGQLREPGRYAVVCFIPTGADPRAYLDALEANPGQPPAVDGGPPHFTQGMVQEVTVT